MYKYTLFTVILVTQLLALYDVGDTISPEDQNMEFGYCYPNDSLSTTFSFVEHNGDLNGGNYQVIMLERSAAW